MAWKRLMDEYEPKTAGRQCALLQELLHYGFPWGPRSALDEFEVLLRRCAALAGEEVSENLKISLVQKGLGDDPLKTHLVLHASRLKTFKPPHTSRNASSTLPTRGAIRREMRNPFRAGSDATFINGHRAAERAAIIKSLAA